MSERLIPARWGGAALPAGASLPLAFSCPASSPLRCGGPGLVRLASSRCSRRPLPSRLAGPGSARPPSAAPRAQAVGPCDEPPGGSVRAAAAEPRGAPNPRLQRPHLRRDPLSRSCSVGGGAQCASMSGTHLSPSPRAARRMGDELALYPSGLGAANCILWRDPTAILRGRGFFTLRDRRGHRGREW